MLIAMDLEQKFSKQRIFEMYANQVPMGQRGSFSIMGVGEAARAYFNKDLKDFRPNDVSPFDAMISADI